MEPNFSLKRDVPPTALVQRGGAERAAAVLEPPSTDPLAEACGCKSGWPFRVARRAARVAHAAETSAQRHLLGLLLRRRAPCVTGGRRRASERLHGESRAHSHVEARVQEEQWRRLISPAATTRAGPARLQHQVERLGPSSRRSTGGLSAESPEARQAGDGT